MSASICTSTKGDLFCRETRQKFSTKYYTFKRQTSKIIEDLESRGSKGTGILAVFPNTADEEMLKKLLSGETFPGSGVRTESVLNELSAQELELWKRSFPALFCGQAAAVEPVKEVAEKPVEKKRSVAKKAEPAPAEDIFGDLE